MTKRWMVALAGAMLSPFAMAAVTVTLEGSYLSASRTVDCPADTTDCSAYTTDIGFSTPLAYSQTFTFEFGVSPGLVPFYTSQTTITDPSTGRDKDLLYFSHRYSNVSHSGLSSSQVPAAPADVFNPVVGTLGSTVIVRNLATRIRTIDAWKDSGEVIQAREGFNLFSTELGDAPDGSSYSRQLSLGLNARFLALAASDFNRQESTAYFLEELNRLGSCDSCLHLSYLDNYWRADGSYGATNFQGRARIISIIETASAVPEPSAYALMLAGVAAIGFAARRRRSG